MFKQQIMKSKTILTLLMLCLCINIEAIDKVVTVKDAETKKPIGYVSALVTFYQLVQPAIAKLSGKKHPKKQPHFQAIAQNNMKKAPGRLDFQRGFYQINENGQLEVHPVGFQGSHLFSSFVKSNCFIRLEKDRGNVAAGEIVTIESFNHLLGQ